MLTPLLNNTVIKQKNKTPVFKPFVQEHEITAVYVSLKEG